MKTTLVFFADDTNAFYSHESLSELNKIINSDLKLLDEWFRTNCLSLNAKKSCYIIFSSQKKKRGEQNINITIDGNSMNQVTSTKFLGVYIDQHLTWVDHIKILANKIAKNIGIIRKISHFLTTKILTSLYYSLIYPYLTYGNIVWASNYQTRTKSLVTLQKKVIRIIKGQKWNDHTQPIFEELGIMKFDNLNNYLIGLFTYKVVYNLIPSPVSNYFTKREQVHAYSLRASGNLSIQFSRTNCRKHALTCRGPIIWNNIPKDIRNITY